ncbi:hypothetical protein [Streptomyces sp. NPDC091027]|uniref:hypothetical protein n=1 Tax=Streptomyces sp. NPDC091027 TaxID=3365971 RepID=UPI003812325A
MGRLFLQGLLALLAARPASSAGGACTLLGRWAAHSRSLTVVRQAALQAGFVLTATSSATAPAAWVPEAGVVSRKGGNEDQRLGSAVDLPTVSR